MSDVIKTRGLTENKKLLVNRQIEFTDNNGEKIFVTPLSNISPPFIPFYIEYETFSPDKCPGTYLHRFDDDELNTFYDLETGQLISGQSFEFKRLQSGSFEIDKWCRKDFKNDFDNSQVELCFSDFLTPSFGSYSQRISAMHSRLTDKMRDEMIDNLNSIYYGQQKGESDNLDADDLPKVTEKLTKPGVFAPPGSSPYALRGEHIRRSILCRGVDAMAEIEKDMMPWEQDFAINQACKWEEKVKAMVFTTIGALLSRQLDVRTASDFNLYEFEKNLLRWEREGEATESENYWKWPTNDSKERLESCAAPIWDSGVEKPPFGRHNNNKNVDYASSDVTSRVIQYLVPTLKKMKSRDTELLNELKAKLGAVSKDRTDDESIYVDTEFILSNIGFKKKTKLEIRDISRDFTRDKMVLQGTFPFTDKEESEFAEKVWSIFSCYCDYKTSVNFFYMEDVYPESGYSYAVESVQFGPSNSLKNSLYSIGHGVNLLMEGTEIAGSFLQNSVWSQRIRANEENPYQETVDFRATGIEPLAFDGGSTWSKKKKPAEDKSADTKKIYQYYSGMLSPEILADWLSANFLGYCYERAHVLDKPMFAKLVHEPTIKRLKEHAKNNGFVDTGKIYGDRVTGGEETKDEEARMHLFKLMKHEAHSSGPTERRMKRLVQPYVVSITASSMGTGIQSFMHMENWWGPRPDFFSVEAECVYILKQLCRERFTRKRHFSGVLRYEGTVGSFVSEQLHLANKLSFFISKAADAQAAASVAVRLIEAVQAANDGVSDGGRTQRDKAGREYVNQARFSYGMQLLEHRKKV